MNPPNLMMRIMFSPLLLSISLQAGTYNVKDFGAVGDGKTINTTAIQNAINQCRDNGGGTVIIPSGIFVTGVIRLYSNINLHLEIGAALKGSANLADYNLNGQRVGMIYTEYADNVAITGVGTIDGNGDIFMDLTKAKKIDFEGSKYTRQKEHFREVKEGVADGPVVPLERPFQMIIFSVCKNVTVRDVMITNSPFWTIHFADCDGVIVSGIKIWNSLLVPNNDGLDFTSCSNVLISDCDIRCGDDGLVFTGYDHHFDLPGYKYLKHDSENINVTNCNLVSRSSGIRIGGLDQNSMRNYNFSNITISNSNRGIGLFVRDKGSIEDMTFTNIVIKTRLHTGDWWGQGEPIHLSAVRLTKEVTLGKLRNIKFLNIICRSESGILVYGSDESVIENVSFNGISLHIADGGLNDVAGGNFDLRPVLDPALQLFAHDIPAFYAQHVSNLTIDDFDLTWDEVRNHFFTHGIEMQNFENVTVNRFSGAQAPSNPKAFPLLVANGIGFKTDLSKELYSKRNVK
ncbi:MAG: glycosyl hydrolase family 28 protein [candidate division KSB1 bacterium]|nr:glycosyl hydrolase family 28 protein [candidate division KSB1 bacterium]